jgi:uncharacterized damage-inducible protein DinB
MQSFDRRNFLKTGTLLSAGLTALTTPIIQANEPLQLDESSMYMVGPVKGYTPYIGILVSMLNYNRESIIRMVKGFSVAQLDHLLDKNSNSIGSLLLHLAATDKFYQINTFEGRGDFNEEEKKIWGAAWELGDKGRAEIKGHDVQYYLDILAEVRNKTLEELKKKDDAWMLAVDPKWSQPTQQLNTFWKWFHVCEHESNHRGQIAYQRTRLPGSKWAKE